MYKKKEMKSGNTKTCLHSLSQWKISSHTKETECIKWNDANSSSEPSNGLALMTSGNAHETL